MPLLPDDDILHHVIGGPQLDPIVLKPILGSSMPDKDKEPTCVWSKIKKHPLEWWQSTCGVSGASPLVEWDNCPYCGNRLEVKDAPIL